MQRNEQETTEVTSLPVREGGYVFSGSSAKNCNSVGLFVSLGLLVHLGSCVSMWPPDHYTPNTVGNRQLAEPSKPGQTCVAHSEAGELTPAYQDS